MARFKSNKSKTQVIKVQVQMISIEIAKLR